MNDSLKRMLGLLDYLSLVVNGLRRIAFVFLIFALSGGPLAFIGFLRAGWFWWLGLLVGLVLMAPAIVLWRFRKSLDSAAALPGRIRELPTDLGNAFEVVKDEFGPLSDALSDVVHNPKSPWTFIRSVRSGIAYCRWTDVPTGWGPLAAIEE